MKFKTTSKLKKENTDDTPGNIEESFASKTTFL